MKYFIIISMFSLNFLLWKSPLKNITKRILKSKIHIYYMLTFVCFFLLPYIMSLVVLKMLNMDTKVLSNIMIIFALLYVSIVSSVKYLKHEK